MLKHSKSEYEVHYSLNYEVINMIQASIRQRVKRVRKSKSDSDVGLQIFCQVKQIHPLTTKNCISEEKCKHLQSIYVQIPECNHKAYRF